MRRRLLWQIGGKAQPEAPGRVQTEQGHERRGEGERERKGRESEEVRKPRAKRTKKRGLRGHAPKLAELYRGRG